MRPNMRPMEKTDLKGALNDLSTYMRKSLGVVVLALELGKMKKEGLLDYHKEHFVLNI